MPTDGRDEHHTNSRRTRRRLETHNEFQRRGNTQAPETIIGPAPGRRNVLPRSVVADFPLNDARLLREFSARHAGFLLSEQTHPPDIRRGAYEYFANFLNLLRSHSTLDLMTTLKSHVAEGLDVINMYGFRGEWFDDLVLRLNPSYLDIAEEELRNLTDQEATYTDSKLVGELEEEYAILTYKLRELRRKISDEKLAMDYVSNRKKQVMEEIASFNAPFNI